MCSLGPQKTEATGRRPLPDVLCLCPHPSTPSSSQVASQRLPLQGLQLHLTSKPRASPLNLGDWSLLLKAPLSCFFGSTGLPCLPSAWNMSSPSCAPEVGPADLCTPSLVALAHMHSLQDNFTPHSCLGLCPELPATDPPGVLLWRPPPIRLSAQKRAPKPTKREGGTPVPLVR